MAKKTASQAALEMLHAELAKRFATKLQEGTCTAADFNVIRAFLKDNNIDAIPTEGSPLGALLDELPHPDPDAIAAEDQTYN